MRSYKTYTSFLMILVLCTCCKSDKVCDDGYFQEKDGIVVFEAEGIKLTEGWALENSIKDYSGEGYITWKDSTITETNNQGLLRYDFQITTGGIYTLKMRNYHSCEDFTECNDVFVKLDNGEWRKNFNHTVSNWDWNSQQDINHVFSNSKFDLNKGMQTLYLSGRSKNFSIDKIAFFLQESTKVEYKTAALSKCVIK
jgi:hypothetical protein